MKKSIALFMVGIVASVFSVATYAVDVPYTFSANTPAVASQVNSNFTALKNGINGVINSLASTTFIYEKRTLTHLSGVGVSSCLSGEIIVGAACYCTGGHSTGQNFGVLFSCNIAGNSAVGGCYASLFDPNLASSPVEVTAICSDITVGSALPSAAKTSSPIDDPVANAAADILRARTAEMHELLINK